MEKIKMLYDGSLLRNKYIKNSGRSGIYFVAANFLKALDATGKYDIKVYFDRYDKELKNAIETDEEFHYQVVNLPDIQCIRQSGILDKFNVDVFAGFYFVEGDCFWAGKQAQISFMLGTIPKEDVYVLLNIDFLYSTVTRMDIRYKGESLYIWENTAPWEKNVLVKVPIGLIASERTITLEIECEGAASPLLLGESDDERVLGCYVRDVAVILDQERKEHCDRAEYEKIWEQREALSPQTQLGDWLKGELINYDVYFSPFAPLPECVDKDEHIKKCVMVHDLIPLLYPERMSEFSITHMQKMIVSIKNDYLVMVNSENTKRDLIRFAAQVTPKNIAVTQLACGNNYVPCTDRIEEVKRKYKIPNDKKYVFSLCTLDPRKNLLRVAKTFLAFVKENEISDMIFVLGGGYWDAFRNEFEEKIGEDSQVKDLISYIGYVDDEDLNVLYSNAMWFVYTSQYEGFGMPPLEAMSCGCPVITSNNSSLPEVVGDAGIMIDWDSDEAHIDSYKKLYFDANLREEYAKKGLERAAQFSWEHCAQVITEKIEDALQKKQAISIDNKENWNLEKWMEQQNDKKQFPVGYCAGVYDLFHIGHVNLFRRAKERCKYLIVGVLTDELVVHFKKNAPYIPFEERLQMVASCRYVDRAVPVTFETIGKLDAWERYHYDAFFSGDDYEGNPVWMEEKRLLNERGSDVVFFSYTQTTSSTKIKNAIEAQINN